MNRVQHDFVSQRAKSWHIFEGNYRDLNSSCEDLENPETAFKHGELTHTMHEDAYLRLLEVERKFHNFLASAKSLVDHTRIQMGELSANSLYADYMKRVERCSNNPSVVFCHDLRNYFLHCGNPSDLYCSHTLWNEENKTLFTRWYLKITKKSLLRHSKWSAKSRAYLAQVEESVDVKELACDYYAEVKELHRWLTYEFLSSLDGET